MSSRTDEPATAHDADEGELREIKRYHRVRQFYNEEARRIDDREFDAWLEMLTDDVNYRIPVRSTTAEGGQTEFQEMCHVDANRWRLEKRVERLDSEHAWAERPHTRTRHYVSNVRIDEVDETELDVRSNLLVFVNRGSSPEYDFVSGERHDVLRRGEDGLKLDSRTIYLDQATLPLDKLSVFV